jgi:PD-(D/E)XK nuclease superfamily
MSASLSPKFLADLAQVYVTLRPQALSAAFLSDLEKVYAALPAPSEASFLFLAQRFENWRRVTRELVRTRLAELDKDDPLLCRISLFRTMDSGRLEMAHTRTLAWLLDPKKNEEHGFGDILLAALLGRLADRDHFDCLQVQRVASEDPLEGSAGEGRLDVLAEGEWESIGERVRWTLVIEAKVDAWEGGGQLDKYDDWLHSHCAGRRVFRVFLTPDGRAPETGAEEWEPLSFLELVRILRGVYAALRHAPGFHFLRFYLAGVLQDVCRLPRIVGEDAADPYAVASYLKTVHDSHLKVASHDAAQ